MTWYATSWILISVNPDTHENKFYTMTEWSVECLTPPAYAEAVKNGFAKFYTIRHGPRDDKGKREIDAIYDWQIIKSISAWFVGEFHARNPASSNFKLPSVPNTYFYFDKKDWLDKRQEKLNKGYQRHTVYDLIIDVPNADNDGWYNQTDNEREYHADTSIINNIRTNANYPGAIIDMPKELEWNSNTRRFNMPNEEISASIFPEAGAKSILFSSEKKQTILYVAIAVVAGFLGAIMAKKFNL